MKSKISCFNAGIAKNLLRRFWPLWLGYFLALLLVPFTLYGKLRDFNPTVDLSPGLDFMLGNLRGFMLFLCFGAAVLAAMAVFSFLYNTRSCGQFNSLPVTRTCLFFSVFLTGALAFFAADLLACAITALLCLSGYLSFGSVMDFFAVLVFSKTFFYSFAAFCAMLTGSLLILPCVYVVLNFSFFVAELCIRDILSKVIYGLNASDLHLTFLSPLIFMVKKLDVIYMEWPKLAQLRGSGTTAAYALVGLAFVLLAWRLFLRRRMETAGDTVAIRILKPVFQYCMCFGSAVVFADLVYSLADLKTGGRNATLLLLLLMLVGAFLGYFAARMLIDKTLRVFRGHWKGFFLSAAVIVLFMGACEFDLLGVEKHVPDTEEVESVLVNGVELKEEENLMQTLAFQQSLLAHKTRHESLSGPGGESFSQNGTAILLRRNVQIDYRLNNGKTLSRSYTICADEKDIEDPDSDLRMFEELFNCSEALESRCSLSYPLTAEHIVSADLEMILLDGNGKHYYYSDNVPITTEELIDLWQNGVLPDLDEGHIARRALCERDRGWVYTNAQLIFCLVPDREAYLRSGGNSYEQQWVLVQFATDSKHCLDWIEAHTGIRPTASDTSAAYAVYGAG